MTEKCNAAVAYTTDELVTWLENKWRRHGEVEDRFAAERLTALATLLGDIKTDLEMRGARVVCPLSPRVWKRLLDSVQSSEHT